MSNTEKLMAEVLEKQTELIKELKTKANTSETATRLHGGGGIFSTLGLEREVVSAHVRPFGIGKILPLLPSLDEDPRFAFLTGYTEAVGSEPTSSCETAPRAYPKSAKLTARFGLIRRDTGTIEWDKVRLRVRRGDFTDLTLAGRVLGLSGLTPSDLNENDMLDIITKSEMITAAVAAERVLSRQIWQGSVSVSGQFPGLDSQIATGQVDADTGVAVPALDSDVKNYGYNLISSNIVDYVSSMEHYLFHNAETMGLSPVQWVIAMRPELWDELSAIWPCAYNTNRCASNVSAGQVMIDGREMVTIRDSMRKGMTIDINGRVYPVVVDSGIYEHNNANNATLKPGEFASTIYMVPITVAGTLPATFRQYIDYRESNRDTALMRGLQSFWTDDGVYSWAISQTLWCYQLHLKTEQRVVLRTPHLAGRIDAIKYVPLQHLREPYPDSPYFFDGGSSVGPSLGTYHAVWA